MTVYTSTTSGMHYRIDKCANICCSRKRNVNVPSANQPLNVTFKFGLTIPLKDILKMFSYLMM